MNAQAIQALRDALAVLRQDDAPSLARAAATGKAEGAIAALAAPKEAGLSDELIVRLQHYVDHLGDMQDGFAGGDPQAVRDALDELLRHRAALAAPGVESFDFYWLVELFRPYGGNSLGQFDAPGCPTTRPVEAYRYATRKDAEYAASKCDAGPDTEWRAAEHGFLRAAPSKEAGAGFALVPLEPTEAMIDAALNLQGEDARLARAPALMRALRKIYLAMLAAANQPGDQRQEGADSRVCYMCGHRADEHPWVDRVGGGRERGKCPEPASPPPEAAAAVGDVIENGHATVKWLTSEAAARRGKDDFVAGCFADAAGYVNDLLAALASPTGVDDARDARRYRHMRSTHLPGPYGKHRLEWYLPRRTRTTAEGLDEAIDAELAALAARDGGAKA